MKIIELNIGLTSKTLGKLNPNEVLNALTGRGFTILRYRLAESISQDGPEKCLAVKCEVPSDWQSELSDLADHFGQNCIAIVGFIGHAPYDTFIPSRWVSPLRFCVEYSPDGVIWCLQKLPFKISPIYYSSESAAIAAVKLATDYTARNNDVPQYVFRVVPQPN